MYNMHNGSANVLWTVFSFLFPDKRVFRYIDRRQEHQKFKEKRILFAVVVPRRTVAPKPVAQPSAVVPGTL